MRLLFRAMGRYKKAVAVCILLKLFGTVSELLLPYILEHIIDDVENSVQIEKFQGPQISLSEGLERVENTGLAGQIAFSPHELGPMWQKCFLR